MEDLSWYTSYQRSVERAHSNIFDFLVEQSKLPGAPPREVTTCISTAAWVITELQTSGWF